MVLRDDNAIGRNSGLSGGPLPRLAFGSHAKRAIDIVAAITGLAIFAPLFVVSAIAVAAESRGPIIVREDRYALGNRRVRVFKFRTVSTGATDPSLTRIGRVLAETEIAELPQLLNVLRGEMSIIGPPLYIDPAKVLHYQDRVGSPSGVKPGLTNWASLTAGRGYFRRR